LRFKTLILLALSTTAAFAQQRGPAIVPKPADARPASDLMSAPSVILGNGQITAKIFLPDQPGSFYRGTRFDRFGTVGSLTYKGQEYYGPWFEQTADVRDYVMTSEGVVAGPQSADSGPVEEFNNNAKALNFDATPPGGTFIKIGVGILRRPDDKPYDTYRSYEVVSRGKLSTKTTKNAITFTQDIYDPNSGTGYHYVKTLRLVPGKPQLVIEHLLENKGQTEFSTMVYDHNFLVMSPGNADLQITVPYTLAPQPPPQPGRPTIDGQLKLDDHSITYLRPLALTERGAGVQMLGFGPTAADYAFEIKNVRTGAGVAVKGDQPMARNSLFALHSIAAVEPYIAIDLAPKAKKSWSYTYTYSAPKGP
jgi:hypothetical protein